MPRFVTKADGVYVDASDRLVTRFRTQCAECQTIVADKAARDSHKCPPVKP